MAGRLAAIEDSLATLVAGHARTETRLDGVETKLDGVETKLDRVETKLDRVETRLDGVETKLGRVETRLDRVETKLDRVDSQLQDMMHQMLVLHEHTIDKMVALAPDYHPIRREFIEADARLREDIERRLDPLEALARQQARKLDPAG